MLFYNFNRAIRSSNQEQEVDERKECETKCRIATIVFDFTVKDSFDNDVCLDKYRGYVVLIVNIASNCNQTAINYANLMELKQKYFDAGLRILSFPCNQFGQGMPENDGEQMFQHLRTFNANFGDVFKKIHVNGDHANPLFIYLKSRKGCAFGNGIRWNFTKFLIDKNGVPVARFSTNTIPTAICIQIENLLS